MKSNKPRKPVRRSQPMPVCYIFRKFSISFLPWAVNTLSG